MNIIHTLPEIDAPAWKKVGNHDKPKRGVPGRHHNNIKVPPETILAMRRMHEIEGKSLRQVQLAHPELQAGYVRSVIEYRIRGNLRVKT